MSWRLEIRHTSGYRYAGEVTSSYNEARVTPLSTHRQMALETSVTVIPAVPTFRYWDYWGTLVDAFDVHVPHTELSVIGESVVETSEPETSSPRATWDDLRRPEVTDSFAELLAATARVPDLSDNEEMSDLLPRLAAYPTPEAAVGASVEWVRGRLTYKKGSTEVTSTAADALSGGTGVCQDYTHLTLAVLRGIGIPARYVSGYLHPSSDATVGTTAIGESHAWVEAWAGDWWGVDPTHGRPVGERHVVVGRGREYGDIAPLKGIYHGAPASAMNVSVELTRLA
ncbi:MAG: transglutaminase family protein [Actinomycetota bacterium]|nr:transglutaminase family protein [Actinomycetota bacterium]